MDANRDRLAEVGVRYWSAGRNHSPFLSALVRPPEARMRLAAARKADVDALRASLAREIASAETFVISGENMSTYSPADFARLREILGDVHLQGVVYLREPMSRLTSGVQQRLRGGWTLQDALARRDSSLPRTERVINALGRQAVILRPYTPKGLIEDLLEVLGLPKTTELAQDDQQVNPSISHTAAMLLDAVNTFAQEDPERRPYNAGKLAVRLTTKHPGPKFQLPPEVLERHVRRHVQDFDLLSSWLGQDIRALPGTTLPPPPDPVIDPAEIRSLYESAVGPARQGGRSRPAQTASA